MKLSHFFLAVFFSFLFFSCDEVNNSLVPKNNQELSKLKKSIRKSINDSIIKADSAKVIVAITKIDKRTKVILYDNNKWEYKSSTNKISTKPSTKISQSQIRSLVQTTRPVKSEYISNGLCGAPTKKGGSCQRRVKGGGRCYQH